MPECGYRRALTHPLVVTAAGELPCILTIFVRKYWELLFLRLLTGISLGGIFPLVGACFP